MSQNQVLEVPIESTSASATNILDVNFDCLDAIFSSKCLSVMDLCPIAEAHSYLKEVVGGVFAKRQTNYVINLEQITERGNSRRILRNFGAFVTELSITATHEPEEKINSECLDWVIECCSNSLESLELNDMNITEAGAIILKPLFVKLRKISIILCNVYSGKMLFNNCASLVELKLWSVKLDDPHSVLENTFTNLVRFEHDYWGRQSDSIVDSIWNEFFSRHKNLRAIILSRSEGISSLLPMIANNCQQLAELEIKFENHDYGVKFRRALLSILALEHLNKLNIRCDDRNITNFILRLQHLKSLEFLSLQFASANSELVPALSKLTRLQSLELISCRGLTNIYPLAELALLTELKIWSIEDLNFDLVLMIKRLTRIKTLHFCVSTFEMDNLTYLRIVNVLRERSDRLQDTLKIRCFRAIDFVADEQFDKILRVTRFSDID